MLHFLPSEHIKKLLRYQCNFNQKSIKHHYVIMIIIYFFIEELCITLSKKFYQYILNLFFTQLTYAIAAAHSSVLIICLPHFCISEYSWTKTNHQKITKKRHSYHHCNLSNILTKCTKTRLFTAFNEWSNLWKHSKTKRLEIYRVYSKVKAWVWFFRIWAK